MTTEQYDWIASQWRFHRGRSGFKDMKFPKVLRENHDWHVSQLNYYYLQLKKAEHRSCKYMEPKMITSINSYLA